MENDIIKKEREMFLKEIERLRELKNVLLNEEKKIGESVDKQLSIIKNRKQINDIEKEITEHLKAIEKFENMLGSKK